MVGTHKRRIVFCDRSKGECHELCVSGWPMRVSDTFTHSNGFTVTRISTAKLQSCALSYRIYSIGILKQAEGGVPGNLRRRTQSMQSLNELEMRFRSSGKETTALTKNRR